jgi:hypothetical protein
VFPITAYLGKPLSSEVPYRYHQAIADETGLPMILFTLQPALGGTDFSDATLLRLTEIPQVVAIKEALFDAKRFRETVDVMRSAGRPITVLPGNDNFIWESYLLGAEGALLGACAVTTRTHVDVYQAAMRGDWSTVRERRPHPEGVDRSSPRPCATTGRCKEVLDAGHPENTRGRHWFRSGREDRQGFSGPRGGGQL